MRKSFSVNFRLASAALMVLGFSCNSPAAPAPAPEPTAPVLATANDGYLILDGRDDSMPPRFCPPNASTDQGQHECRVSHPGLFNLDTPAKPVTAQEALDLKYGAGKAVVVGVAPYEWHSSVIYWRYGAAYKK